jgi:hypothetical protein
MKITVSTFADQVVSVEVCGSRASPRSMAPALPVAVEISK